MDEALEAVYLTASVGGQGTEVRIRELTRASRPREGRASLNGVGGGVNTTPLVGECLISGDDSPNYWGRRCLSYIGRQLLECKWVTTLEWAQMRRRRAGNLRPLGVCDGRETWSVGTCMGTLNK